MRRSPLPLLREATRVEVDLSAVRANARDVKALVGPAKGVLAVLKADAYGHGLVAVGRALDDDGSVAGMVVTSPRDGLALRREGVGCPIVVLSTDYTGAHVAILEAGLTPVVASLDDLDDFAGAARTQHTRVAVHVKIDTGMSRLGLREVEIEPFLNAAARHPGLIIDGMCTQLTSADDDPAKTAAQLDRFERAVARFRAAGHRPSFLHAANTAATFRHPRAHFTHVRVGIALFGGDEPSGARLRPALRLVSRVTRLRTVEAGESVSYGGLWTAPRPSLVATLPVGYAHGYPRRMTGRAEVIVRGRRCRVVGAICMESLLVDVTDLGGEVETGDEAVLVGAEGGEEILAADVARSIGGIVEEVFCGLSPAVAREYVGASRGRVEPARDRTWRASERPRSFEGAL